jgi:hypothetical protein
MELRSELESENNLLNLMASLATVVLLLAGGLARVYMGVYAYSNLLQPHFSSLPTLTPGQFWGITVCLTVIFCKIPVEKNKKSALIQFEEAFKRAFIIGFLWLFVFLVVTVLK